LFAAGTGTSRRDRVEALRQVPAKILARFAAAIEEIPPNDEGSSSPMVKGRVGDTPRTALLRRAFDHPAELSLF
jgi:hypothetical protein